MTPEPPGPRPSLRGNAPVLKGFGVTLNYLLRRCLGKRFGRLRGGASFGGCIARTLNLRSIVFNRPIRKLVTKL